MKKTKYLLLTTFLTALVFSLFSIVRESVGQSPIPSNYNGTVKPCGKGNKGSKCGAPGAFKNCYRSGGDCKGAGGLGHEELDLD
ncbi:hypothetical protein [Hugenholtzia roseola]|uniref:hypothetical protein n=1 Tax=Hugenholtzia roseola TaxID=1002 RepID=UPI0012B58BA8|nr:hypothetical protein [Hugenholtzia roseola]